jgi:thiol:disulfide interchange protein
MRISFVILSWSLAAVAWAEPPAPASAPAPAQAAPAPKKKHEPLTGYATYDPTLDGKKQLSDALVTAKAAHKRVLVMFGGNWCKWCKALDATMQTHEATKKIIEDGYVLVHIDSDSNLALNTELGDPFKNGFPVLVVFNDDGSVKKIQETGSLEIEGAVGHDPEKVRAFLAVHAPKKK